MDRATPAMLLLVLALAGCAADARISYHGEEPGVDTSSFACEKGAQTVTIEVTYKGDFGKKFSVQALTPINKEAAFNQTFTLPGPDEREEPFELDAIQGAWELRVERIAPFKGNIEVRAKC